MLFQMTQVNTKEISTLLMQLFFSFFLCIAVQNKGQFHIG